MGIFFTSDQHFGHANVIQHCGRPFSDVREMDEVLIERFNHKVSAGDTTYHVGDFSFRGVAEQRAYLKRLNGRHLIIRGNHDRTTSSMRSVGFADACNSLQLVVDGTRVFMRHVPPRELKGEDARDFERYLLEEPTDGHFDLFLCGHVHEKWKARTIPDWRGIMERVHVVNVGVDQWDFEPVTIHELRAAASN